RKRLELAATQVDIVDAVETFSGGLQLRRRAVARDNSLHERREGRPHLSGAAAEVADDPIPVGECRERGEVEAIAKEVVAQPIPLSCRRGEKLLRLGSTIR